MISRPSISIRPLAVLFVFALVGACGSGSSGGSTSTFKLDGTLGGKPVHFDGTLGDTDTPWFGEAPGVAGLVTPYFGTPAGQSPSIKYFVQVGGQFAFGPNAARGCGGCGEYLDIKANGGGGESIQGGSTTVSRIRWTGDKSHPLEWTMHYSGSAQPPGMAGDTITWSADLVLRRDCQALGPRDPGCGQGFDLRYPPTPHDTLGPLSAASSTAALPRWSRPSSAEPT